MCNLLAHKSYKFVVKRSAPLLDTVLSCYQIFINVNIPLNKWYHVYFQNGIPQVQTASTHISQGQQQLTCTGILSQPHIPNSHIQQQAGPGFFSQQTLSQQLAGPGFISQQTLSQQLAGPGFISQPTPSQQQDPQVKLLKMLRIQPA